MRAALGNAGWPNYRIFQGLSGCSRILSQNNVEWRVLAVRIGQCEKSKRFLLLRNTDTIFFALSVRKGKQSQKRYFNVTDTLWM